MNYKVLVVDDHEDTLKLVKDILEKEGYQVATASDRTEAISALAEEEFHLILLDILLPGDNGWELCIEIRKKFRDMKIAYLTVLKRSQYIERRGIDDLRKLKISDYIEKPFDNNMLLERISAILSQ